jgi:hypothetical protein
MIEETAAAVLVKITDLETAQLGPEYSYQSLPLCVIDAVFSIGVRYINVQRVVEAWCVAQTSPWIKFEMPTEPRKTLDDFLRVADGFSPDDLAARYFGGNRQRTSTRGGILKAEAAVLYAKALKSVGINDFKDIRSREVAALGRQAVSKVTGHASGISYDYLLMLAGDDSFVKADRMICRFVADAANLSTVSPAQAQEAVVGACRKLSGQYPTLTPRLLDHLIWLYQRESQQVGV